MKKISVLLILLSVFLISFSGCTIESGIDSPDWAIGNWYCDYGYGLYQRLTITGDDVNIKNNSGSGNLSDFGVKDSSYSDTVFVITTEEYVLSSKTHTFTLELDGTLSFHGDSYIKTDN